jgi:hypothetical protein
MDRYGKVGVMITSYEGSPGKEKAILSHVFWGETTKEAFSYAKSHLKTDYFFSSTFVGSMPWGDSTLVLSYNVSGMELRR